MGLTSGPESVHQLSQLRDVKKRFFIPDDSLEKQKAILGIDHPNTLLTMNNLALAYEKLAKYDEAEKLYIEWF